MSHFIKKLHLRNLLSFEDCEVELQNLNILIGPNGAGKSNLIEAIGLLRSLVYDHAAYVRQGGGSTAWIWKGQRGESAQMDTLIDGGAHGDLLHSFKMDGTAAGLTWEQLLIVNTESYSFKRESGQLSISQGYSGPYTSSESVFHKYKDPADKSPTTRTGERIGEIRIYREFRTGKNEMLRSGGPGSGLEATHLEEGGQNLALVLHEFDSLGRLDQIRGLLEELNQGYRNIKPRFLNGIWLVQLNEEGLLDPVMSQRISDGTLKFICLAALLLDPSPPPVICIEEPEVGLHPDAMRVVARLLREAADRTQLIVTTHSADMIDEFSGTPEAVVVTEKNERHATQFNRLDRDKLASWLGRYQLGELWQKGEIGGSRW